MSPLQMAKAECANYESDGSCCGIGIRLPKCLLADGKRCRYFEESVLPLEQPIGEQISIVNGRIKQRPLSPASLKSWKQGQRDYKEMVLKGQ